MCTIVCWHHFKSVTSMAPTSRLSALFFEFLYLVIDLDLPIILCGYFNTIIDAYKDRRGCNP